MIRQLTTTLGSAVSLVAVCASLPSPAGDAPIVCPGVYRGHLQGLATDGEGAIYWCFTVALVKTDMTGKLQQEIAVGSHHGDLTVHDGKVYVAVNFGSFNKEPGSEDSWVYVYQASDLAFVSKHAVPELVHGAGGMAYHNGRFMIIGGLPETHNVNTVYEYDDTLTFVRKHVLPTGYTKLGIQTACYGDGHWWFGCYGKKLLKTSATLELLAVYDFDCAMGIASRGEGRYLIARGTTPKYGARAHPARGDSTLGIALAGR